MSVGECPDDFVDHECPYCGGYLGIDCTCTDGDEDYYNGMYAYEDWYKSLSPIRRFAEGVLRRFAEDVLRRTQNLRWRITWKLKEWWREIHGEELPF